MTTRSFRYNCLKILAFSIAQHAYASAIDLSAIKVSAVSAKPNGYRPAIALGGDTLVMAQTKHNGTVAGNVIFYNVLTQSKNTIEGFPGNVSVAISPDLKTAALCHKFGGELSLIDMKSQSITKTIQFENEPNMAEALDCFGLSYSPTPVSRGWTGFFQSYYPLWVAAPGESLIVKLDAENEEVLDRLQNISGPFSVVATADKVFTLNATLDWGLGLIEDSSMSMPLAFNIENRVKAIGDRRTDTRFTTLRKDFNNEIYDDSVGSGQVFYVDIAHNEIVGFNAKAPTEAVQLRIKVSLASPQRVARFKSCLVVTGSSADEWLYPQVAVLKQDSSGAYQEVAATGSIEDKTMNGSKEMVVDRFGNIYLSHWKGVSKISGLLSQVDCN